MVDSSSGCRAFSLVLRLVILAALVPRAAAQDDAAGATELARVRETLQQTQHALREAEAGAAELTQVLRAARADTSALQARAEAAEGTAVRMTRARDVATRQAAELRMALAQAQREVSAARSQTPQALESLTQEVLSLRAALAAQEQSAGELRAARARMEEERAAAEQRRIEAEAAAAAALERVDVLSTELAETREQVRQLERVRTDDGASASAELEYLRQRLNAMEEEGRRITNENQQLTAEQAHRDTQAGQRVLELERQLVASRDAGRRLEEAKASLLRERDGLAGQLAVIRAENEQLAASQSSPRAADGTGAAESAGQVAPPGPQPVALHTEPEPRFAASEAPAPPVVSRKPRMAPTRPDGRTHAASAIARPHSAAVTGRVHVAAPGDSLAGISMRYYRTPHRWNAVYEANRAILSRSNGIQPGQRLLVP